MCWVVEIGFSVRVWHTSWITSNNVEVGASCHASFGMPLNLHKSIQQQITQIQSSYSFHKGSNAMKMKKNGQTAKK